MENLKNILFHWEEDLYKIKSIQGKIEHLENAVQNLNNSIHRVYDIKMTLVNENLHTSDALMKEAIKGKIEIWDEQIIEFSNQIGLARKYLFSYLNYNENLSIIQEQDKYYVITYNGLFKDEKERTRITRLLKDMCESNVFVGIKELRFPKIQIRIVFDILVSKGIIKENLVNSNRSECQRVFYQEFGFWVVHGKGNSGQQIDLKNSIPLKSTVNLQRRKDLELALSLIGK